MIKPNGNGFIDLKSALSMDLDPAVSSALTSADKRQAARKLTQRERKKLQREKEKAAKRGPRVTYDLPQSVIAWIKAIAAKHETTASQIVLIGLVHLIKSYIRGDIDLAAYLQPIDSPTYSYTADIELPSNPLTDKNGKLII